MTTERSFLPEFIAQQAKRLAEVGIDVPKSEIEWMLCHVMKIDRLHLYLYGHTLFDEARRARFEEIVQRRLTREPLQFIIEEAWFYGRKFYVNPSVMAPTPETEGLCEAAMGFIERRGWEAPRILDVGVGSGVISVTMACELAGASVVALDVSAEAIEVARRNAHELEVADRIEFRQSDLFSVLADDERFDVILSNPPYIREVDWEDLMPEVKADPKIAMTAGPEGLDIVRRLVADGARYLNPGGRMMFEIGLGQSETVTTIAQEHGAYSFVNCIKDLNDLDRIMILGVSE
ncbi:peptide chain release factor N(5)-glutamine methyltransferase [candidate division GN15 bacterium]|nr:peptide chain release factor N(5)-glutamine methyltransferase [candidate division GN15 bacterium]